jgi:uncharacterized protein
MINILISFEKTGYFMYKKEHMYYSPSDLTKYMESPFASWMDRFAQEYPELVPKQDPNDDLMVMLQQKGYQHEDKLEAMFIAEGKNLIKIEGENNDERYAKTLEAMQSGVEIIVQARLELGQLQDLLTSWSR